MNLTLKDPKEISLQPVFPYNSFSDLPIYDQRYLPRWTTSNKAFYRKENDNVLVLTQLKDLTFEGACLYISGKIKVNDKLKLRITLSNTISFQSKGTVLWKKGNSRLYCAGVRFEPLNEDIQNLILEYGFEHSFSKNAEDF